MKEKIKKYSKEIIIGCIFIIIGMFLFFIYRNFLLAPDEYNYSHIAWTNIKIDSFSKLFESQMSMYKNWTGRLPVHFLIQLMLWKGIWIFKILNPIMFIVFVFLINKLTNKNVKIFNIILTFFCLLYTISAFGDKFLWMSGSVNYLWTTTLMLILMKFYYDIVINTKDLSTKKGILYCFISFFVGWSQENVAFFIGSYIIVIAIYKFKEFLKYSNKKKIFIVSNILFFGIGAILLIFSPGNFSRLDSSVNISLFGKLKNIIRNFYHIKFLIIIYMVTISYIIISKKIFDINSKKEKLEFILKEFIIFILPLGISLIPMLVISEFPDRSMLPYETIILVMIVYNINLIIEKINNNKLFNFISIILFVAIVFNLGNNLYISERILGTYKKEVDSQIKIAKDQNLSDIVITRLDDNKINSNMLLNYSPSSERSGVINIYMSIYYGFNSIIAIQNDEYLVSIKFKEPVEDAKKYSIINTKTKEEISEKNEEGSTDLIEIVIPKDKLKDYKIKFKNDITNKIESINLITNIDIEKKQSDIMQIDYREIVSEE